jgi:hypothetical protein
MYVFASRLPQLAFCTSVGLELRFLTGFTRVT